MFAVSKNNPHRGGILTCAHMLPPSSQRKSSQREDFELGLCASHHLKNNPPKGRIPKRWDKNPVQEILPEGRIINRVLLIEGYLHISTFYSGWSTSIPHWTWIQIKYILNQYKTGVIAKPVQEFSHSEYADDWQQLYNVFNQWSKKVDHIADWQRMLILSLFMHILTLHF